jgi:hypothetical protein
LGPKGNQQLDPILVIAQQARMRATAVAQNTSAAASEKPCDVVTFAIPPSESDTGCSSRPPRSAEPTERGDPGKIASLLQVAPERR